MRAFDKIIGYESIKKELMRLCDMLKNPEIYARLGAKPSRGLLLAGRPGLGKSLMAKCLMEESGRKSFLLRRNKPDGDFIKEIHRVFREAAAAEPSIILLDDMDKFVVEEKSSEEFVALQTAIDAVAERNVYVIATANDLDDIPDSLLRAGRFDRKLTVRYPSGKDAEQIITHYLEQKALGSTVNLSDVTKLLARRSCAELETVLNEAAIYAGSERSEKVEMTHILEAFLRNEYDVACGAPVQAGKELLKIAYHEAGHAVMQELLREGGVGIVCILPENDHYGGFMRACVSGGGDETDRILIHLAGMAATELRFGDPGSGASLDLESARYLVHDAVLEEGMYGLGQLNMDFRGDEGSPASKARQEAIIGAELERYRRLAREMLARNRSFLDAVAAELSEKRTLLNSDIRRIRETCQIDPGCRAG